MVQLLLVLLAVLLFPFSIDAATKDARFFLMGDGKIQIKNMHTGQEASVFLVNPDGSLNEEGFNRIDEVFGFPTREMGEHISPRLLFMLDYFSDLAAPGKTIEMISGYRSPEYNSTLRNGGGNVAKTSLHMDGMALDFHIEGVNGKDLWELIRSKDCCGVGHYGGANIHLDSARPRFWEAATSKVHTGESDHNKRIYASTDYDLYSAGESVRVSLASVSEFGFGIVPTVAIVDDPEGNNSVGVARVESGGSTDCMMMEGRRDARFINFVLPSTLPEGRYRFKIDYCRRPYQDMPLGIITNEIEVLERPSKLSGSFPQK